MDVKSGYHEKSAIISIAHILYVNSAQNYSVYFGLGLRIHELSPNIFMTWSQINKRSHGTHFRLDIFSQPPSQTRTDNYMFPLTVFLALRVCFMVLKVSAAIFVLFQKEASQVMKWFHFYPDTSEAINCERLLKCENPKFLEKEILYLRNIILKASPIFTHSSTRYTSLLCP